MNDSDRYLLVRAREASADGAFVYCVRTTGVYCRPSCRSRLARRENVEFHRGPEEAERAGFRACKRCKPRESTAHGARDALLEGVRRRLETEEPTPTLAALAGDALSPFHLQRLFKARYGVSPREYAAARRLSRATRGLQEGRTVTRAQHDAGYGSSSRFYEAARALGMKPSDLRRGGLGLVVGFHSRRCSLGRAMVATTARGVCALELGDDDDALLACLRARFPGPSWSRTPTTR